jgi:hypothetical protein
MLRVTWQGVYDEALILAWQKPQARLGCIGRLTLVSKCLSEIASTEGTIWIVSMICEREQQIEGGQIKDIGSGK